MALEGEQLGFLEKTVKLIEKYGLFKIFKALCVIAIFVYIMVHGPDLIHGIISNVTRDAIKEEAIEKVKLHDKALGKRQEIKPKIDDILNSTLDYLNASRVFIIEMHNGTNNVSGLPFLYGEMTYEVASDGVEHVDEDYINVSLSRFTLPYKLESTHIWLGSVDELKKIDEKLALKLASNDVTYLAISHIHGIRNELGFFGITYCKNTEPKSRDIIMTKMVESSQKLSTLLDSALLLDEEDNLVNKNKE